MPRRVISGDPGSAWTNDTGKPLYQLIVNWSNSCGLCVQNDHQIGPAWPVPFHQNCSCRNVLVLPNATARPFVDYRAKIQTVPRSQQAVIMGRANLDLVERGVVAWDDVVTPGRIRSLREVVALKRLTVNQMTRAGVPEHAAIEAYQAVHTDQHTRSETERAAKVRALLEQGYNRGQVRSAVVNALAARLGIGSGPSGPSTLPPPPTTPKPKPKPVNPAVIPVAARWSARYQSVIRATLKRLGIAPGDATA